MNLREFRKAGHLPTLFSAFLYFDISFMIWVLIGALAVSISADLWPKPDGVSVEAHLASIASKKGFLVAVPLLGGSILRLVLADDRPHWRSPHRADRLTAHGNSAADGLVVGEQHE